MNTSSRRMTILFGAAVLVAAGLVLPGCSAPAKKAAKEEKPQAKPIVKTADRGAVKLTVEADKDTITIAERLKLTITAEAKPGIEVKMPDFGADMNEFQIRDFKDLPVETLSDGRQQYKQVYDLDIFLSGDYDVPAITIQYRDLRDRKADSDEKDIPSAELSTEPFKVKVTSLLKGQFDPTKFHDVKELATLKRDDSWAWAVWVGGGLALVVIALGGIAFLVRRSRRPKRRVVMPPDVWAMGQLRKLAGEQLIEAGKVKEFHYRLSEITRTYIELRFGLMAPEQTTEEFLESLRNSDALPADRKALLAEFLEACDMVKYALYEPATEEIERVFNAARDFILQTRPAQAEQEVSA